MEGGEGGIIVAAPSTHSCRRLENNALPILSAAIELHRLPACICVYVYVYQLSVSTCERVFV